MIHSAGATGSADAAVLHTHLCGYPWPEVGPNGAPLAVENQAEGTGVSIQLVNLAEWMEQIGAVGYQVTVLQNSERDGVRFFPVSVFRGKALPENLVRAFQGGPSDYHPANYPDGPGGKGARLVHQFPSRFAADSLTLTAPPYDGGQSLSNVSGIILTPVF